MHFNTYWYVWLAVISGIEHFDKIDVLLNAGYAAFGVFERSSIEKIRNYDPKE